MSAPFRVRWWHPRLRRYDYRPFALLGRAVSFAAGIRRLGNRAAALNESGQVWTGAAWVAEEEA